MGFWREARSTPPKRTLLLEQGSHFRRTPCSSAAAVTSATPRGLETSQVTRLGLRGCCRSRSHLGPVCILQCLWVDIVLSTSCSPGPVRVSRLASLRVVKSCVLGHWTGQTKGILQWAVAKAPRASTSPSSRLSSLLDVWARQMRNGCLFWTSWRYRHILVTVVSLGCRVSPNARLSSHFGALEDVRSSGGSKVDVVGTKRSYVEDAWSSTGIKSHSAQHPRP